jgi:hypothetical protein
VGEEFVAEVERDLYLADPGIGLRVRELESSPV